MQLLQTIKDELNQYIDKAKAEFLPRFFKTQPGGYAEGDRFIGVTVPNQRKVAKKYFRLIQLDEVENLLHETFHEYRLTALFILVYKYDEAKSDNEKEAIVNCPEPCCVMRLRSLKKDFDNSF